MDNHEKRIEATYLSNCSPEAAYEWLYERRILDHYSFCATSDKTLEYILIKRKEPLIDLGIAKYGHSDRGIKAVFKRGDAGVRCAALGNPHIGYVRGCNNNGLICYGLEWHVIGSGNDAEHEALIKNPNLSERVIEDLLTRKGLFDSISDEEFIQMIKWLSQNPRMNLTYASNGQTISDCDIFAECRHHKIFDIAWELAETLPTTQDYALALYNLLLGTHIGYSTYKDYPSLIKRWRIEDGAQSGEPSYYPSYYLRSRIADKVKPNDKLLNSRDFAERESFYRRFSPYDYKRWPSFIQRDGEKAFDSMILNDNLWRSGEHRKMLEEIAFDSLTDSDRAIYRMSRFQTICKDRREKYPNWFLEEDDKWGNSTDAIIRRLGKYQEEQKDQKNIIESLEAFSESLTELLKSNKNKLEKEIITSRYSIEDVQNKLSRNIDEALEKALKNIDLMRPIPSKPVAIWPWFVVIGLLIAILLK